jgi:hypothetical protein
MKRLVFALVFVLISTNVFAVSLVSDPQSGVTHHRILGMDWITGNVTTPLIVAAQTDGSLKKDIASSPSGTFTLSVSSCINDPVWGEACSAPVNFTYTRPAPPAITSNIRLIQ